MKEILKNFNKAFENKIRLGIMSALMVNEFLDFNHLKEILDVTDGNLASHLATLEKNGFIQVKKQFLDRKPNTRYIATSKGKDAFEKHLSALEQLITGKKEP